MSMMRGIIAGGVRNPVLVNLLMVCAIVAGVVASASMVREAFPEFKLDYLSISVVYPGASPADAERGVCIPIEEAIRGIEGVREISSIANENLATVWVSLKYDVNDVSRVLDDIKERVDQIPNLPEETEKPIVREMVLKAEVINVSIYGDASERTLKRFAQEVRDDLVARSEISQVTIAGVREEEIIIEVSEEALRAHGLSITDLVAVIKRSSLDLPAGTIRTANEEVTLRITGQRYSAADYEDLVVIEDPSAIVRLGHIATVREGFSDDLENARFNGQRAVLVSIYKTPSEDSETISQIVHDYVEARQNWLPERLNITAWGDTAEVIDSMLSMLVRNGVMGVALVFLALLVFMNIRTAMWVAVGIPVAFSGALVVMWVTGETVNLISIFALIMVSGIIVDDAIVLADAIHIRRRGGESPELASINGAHQMAAPVLGASVTTVAAFIPLLYVVGVMGRFIHVLPIVVIAAIAASAVEAFVILPTHLCERTPTGVLLHDRPPGRFRIMIENGIDRFITTWYRPLYRISLRHRYVTMSIAVASLLLMLGLVFGDHVPLILLPKDDTNIITARVRLPEGAPAEVTNRTIKRLERAAYALNDDPTLMSTSGEPLVHHVSTLTGAFSGFVGFVRTRGNNLCEVQIEMAPAEKRVKTGRVIDRWREITGPLHDAVEFTIDRQQLGPTDHPIEIRLMGGSREDLADAAARVREQIASYRGITDTYNDFVPGKRELQVELRPAARALGLTLDDVARHLRHGFFGGEITTLQRGREQVKVRIRYPADQRRSITDLENERIRTLSGNEIPFHEVASVRWERNYANLWREDGQPRVIIRAVLDEARANANQILSDLDAGPLRNIVDDYNNMTYKFGGDRERLSEALDSLYDGFVLSVIAIYAILASILRSYVQPLVIVIALPFGMIGVIAGHFLLGYDLTLMSLFGTVALSGVVVNDSLVLVDAINGGVREGQFVDDAVARAGELRFRAVILTSVTTVAGLLPLLLETSSRAASVMPMAVALSFGIMFATALTLFIVPASFLVVNDGRRLTHWVRYGGAWPAREQVEEAAVQHLASAK